MYDGIAAYGTVNITIILAIYAITLEVVGARHHSPIKKQYFTDTASRRKGGRIGEFM